MKISAIAAIDSNRGIAKNGHIPWNIPDDMRHFKEITTGHTVIMGRKTFDSIGKPLPNRTNIIITRNSSLIIPECIIANSIEEAIHKAKKIELSEIFIIGGAQVYTNALPYTQRLYLTLIEKSFDCDTFFPDYSEFKNIISTEKKEFGDINYSYQCLTLNNL